jgi:hypothetical protein
MEFCGQIGCWSRLSERGSYREGWVCNEWISLQLSRDSLREIRSGLRSLELLHLEDPSHGRGWAAKRTTGFQYTTSSDPASLVTSTNESL